MRHGLRSASVASASAARRVQSVSEVGLQLLADLRHDGSLASFTVMTVAAAAGAEDSTAAPMRSGADGGTKDEQALPKNRANA